MSVERRSGMLDIDVRLLVGENLSLEQIQAFLQGSDEVGFKGRNRQAGFTGSIS
jgi:hypothetical protein